MKLEPIDVFMWMLTACIWPPAIALSSVYVIYAWRGEEIPEGGGKGIAMFFLTIIGIPAAYYTKRQLLNKGD